MQADIALTNGRFWTVQNDNPWVESVCANDGNIVFVGSSKDALEYIGPVTRVIDLRGRFGLPAFNDSHVHFHPDMVGQAHRLGISCIQDITVRSGLQDLKKMMQGGQPSLRLRLRPPLEEVHDLADYEELSATSEGWIKLIGVKAYADGRISDGSALFFRPAMNQQEDAQFPVIAKVDEWKRHLGAALDCGLAPSVHAMGDRAVHLVLDLFEEIRKECPNNGPRFRVVHASVVGPGDIPRFAELGVVAEVNPVQRFAQDWLRGIIGEQVRWSFPFRSLSDSGAILCFGSDHPGPNASNPFPLDPLLGIYAAVIPTEGDPQSELYHDESLTLEEAIEAYTIRAAYAAGEEETMGSLRCGKVADVIVLSDDLFRVPRDRIPDVEVVLTMIGGIVVFSRTGNVSGIY